MDEHAAVKYILDAVENHRCGDLTLVNLRDAISGALRSHAEFKNSPRSLCTPNREVRTYRGRLRPSKLVDNIIVEASGVGDSIEGLAMEAGASWSQITAGRVDVIVTFSYRADGT